MKSVSVPKDALVNLISPSSNFKPEFHLSSLFLEISQGEGSQVRSLPRVAVSL